MALARYPGPIMSQPECAAVAPAEATLQFDSAKPNRCAAECRGAAAAAERRFWVDDAGVQRFSAAARSGAAVEAAARHWAAISGQRQGRGLDSAATSAALVSASVAAAPVAAFGAAYRAVSICPIRPDRMAWRPSLGARRPRWRRLVKGIARRRATLFARHRAVAGPSAGSRPCAAWAAPS